MKKSDMSVTAGTVFHEVCIFAQRLHLLNSTHIQDKIEKSWRIHGLINSAKGNRRKMVNTIYVTLLSRYPTKTEATVATEYFQTKGITPRQAANDLVWALINTKEFLYRH